MTITAQLDQTRFNMIEQQIRTWNVLEPSVLAQLGVMQREKFLDAAHQSYAFADIEAPLPEGQSMLQPKVEARILQDLQVKKHEKVLEIGTGSGYMAALLGYCAHTVLSLEIRSDLATLARNNLRNAGVRNVEVRHADGAAGSAADGPFDVIVLSGSVAAVPDTLKAQLKVGGRLFAIVGQAPMMRATFMTRTSDSNYQTTQPWDTLAPRLDNFAEPSKFSF
jgi:protein-L-isoaspartate(D-aspartate) O-methyltransferase